eukprot:1259962-Rhodomonas_salina.2
MILRLSLTKAPPRPAMIRLKVAECLDLEARTDLYLDRHLFNQLYAFSLWDADDDLRFHKHLLRVESAGATAPNLADFRLVFASREAARSFAVAHEVVSTLLFANHGRLVRTMI